MKVLVTGASGFIGRQCLPLLCSKGYEVHALCRRQPIPTANVNWHKADLLEKSSTLEILGRVRPEYLLHLAWYTAPGKFRNAPENTQWVEAGRELLSAFAEHGGKRAVVAGTCAEYDWSAGECKEDVTPLRPASLYGQAKRDLHSFCDTFSRETRLSSAWAHIFYIYGPDEDPSRLAAYVINSLLQGRPANCAGRNQIRDFLYVADVAAALVAILSSEVQGAVNVGSGKPVTTGDLLGKIGYYLERRDLLHFDASRSVWGPPALWANTEKLAKEVGWTPQYDLDRGLQETIAWWRRSIAVSPGQDQR